MLLNEYLNRTYKGKRVLVTGHTGFKGSWLTMWLEMLEATVLGVALEPPSQPSMFDELNLNDVIDSRIADINDYVGLSAIFSEFQPEIVIHLAALSLVRPSYRYPLDTLNTNILGTAKVLEACRHAESVHSVVIVTSDKCYRNNEWVWGYRENDPMGGHDPYSASKGCSELITSSYIKSFFQPDEWGKSHKTAVASARAGNAIGGGDWGKDRLIPDCFRALHEGRNIHIRSPRAVRPWQHAMECLSGYLLLGAKLAEEGPKYGCGWNFAPMDMSDIWPVEKVVKYICALWGSGNYMIDCGEHPHEAKMLCLDSSKARMDLEWRPRYKVAEALAKTVEWYKAWSEKQDPVAMRELTRKQIREYMASVDGENA